MYLGYMLDYCSNMLMNFLDLSSASEEERRLISEILSDTSVVNFVESLRQNQEFDQHQQQIQSRGVSDSIRQQRYHSRSIHHPNKTNITQPLYRPHHQQQQPQIQQTNLTTSAANSVNHSLNHVHNHDTSMTLENHRHNNHVQMPTSLAGDINPGVVNMDMTAAQHASYPLPHPTSAHVSPAYPHPPPHHMYGGPPIFQPYPIILPYHNPHLVYGNMPPYSVLPATNSVVTQRQVPPQSNQSTNTNIAAGPHSRVHSHTSRQAKVKDSMNKQNSLNHNQHETSEVPQNQSQYNKSKQIIEANDTTVTSSEIRRPENDYKPLTNRNRLLDDELTIVKNGLDTKTDAINEVEGSKQPDDAANVENGPTQAKKEFETASSDKIDTLISSSDASKQSQELTKDKPSSKENECNAPPGQTNSDLNSDYIEKTVNHNCDGDRVAKRSAWSSASSKSWASLFKGNGSAIFGASLNGESEHNRLELNHSDDETDKSSHKKSDHSNNNGVQTSKSNALKLQRSQDVARRALDKMAPRLAQKITSITLNHSLPYLRPRGFINKGNGCYINSTLQALIACPPFYNLMKEIGDLKDLRRENSCTPILDHFVELFFNFPPSKKNKQVTSSDQRIQLSQLQAEALEPKCIYDVLGQIKSECLRGAQEDAEEFLSSVLNGLHEEMMGLSEILQSLQNNNSSNQNGNRSEAEDINGDPNDDDNLRREVGLTNRSLPNRNATIVNTPIQEIFGGTLFSIRTAGRDRFDDCPPFFDLQLDISGDNVKSLLDAIKSFTATEVIHDFYCSKTKQKLAAQRRTLLDQLPPIFILHLKQFIYTQDHGLKKLMKRIEYPIDFELPDSCLHDKNSDRSSRSSRAYKLLAVVYHEGHEAIKGHYLTDVFHIGSSQWIRCDDGNLKVVPAPRIDNPDSTRTPYLLFYRRHDTLKPPQSGNSSYSHHDISKRKS